LKVSVKEFKQESDKDGSREQYRVVRDDLVFLVYWSGHQKSKGTAERSLSDFRKLASAL